MDERKKYQLTQDMSYCVHCEHITININSQKGNGLLFGPELYCTFKHKEELYGTTQY